MHLKIAAHVAFAILSLGAVADSVSYEEAVRRVNIVSDMMKEADERVQWADLFPRSLPYRFGIFHKNRFQIWIDSANQVVHLRPSGVLHYEQPGFLFLGKEITLLEIIPENESWVPFDETLSWLRYAKKENSFWLESVWVLNVEALDQLPNKPHHCRGENYYSLSTGVNSKIFVCASYDFGGRQCGQCGKVKEPLRLIPVVRERLL